MTDNQSLERKTVTQIWWIMLLQGVVLLALGIIFLIKPGVPLTAVILVMGAYWLVDGVLTVIKAVKERGVRKYWGYGLFVGTISIIAGLIVFSQPMASALLTTTLLVYLVGFAALLSGGTSLATGIRLRNELVHAWYPIIGGAVSILFGVLLISSPVSSINFLVKSLGVIALIVGIVLVAYALRIRGATRRAGG